MKIPGNAGGPPALKYEIADAPDEKLTHSLRPSASGPGAYPDEKPRIRQ